MRNLMTSEVLGHLTEDHTSRGHFCAAPFQDLEELHEKPFAGINGGGGHSRLVVGPWHHLESILSRWALAYMLQTSLEFLQEKV